MINNVMLDVGYHIMNDVELIEGISLPDKTSNLGRFFFLTDLRF